MRFVSQSNPPQPLVSLLGALLLWGSVAFTAPSVIQAQSIQYDQTYGSGTYNQNEFGGTTQPASTDPIPTSESTPSSTPSPTSTPTPAAGGLFPGTGAGLGLWAAIGALVLGVGLGLYGFSRRQSRRA